MTVVLDVDMSALARAAGLDLSAFRSDHVLERVRRALEREHLASVPALVRLLDDDPRARTRFRRSVAVSVSGLFRDPQQFSLLEHEFLPRLLGAPKRLTVWSAGCADGTELYSVGVLVERLGALERTFLLGSDILEENVEVSRRATTVDIAVSDAVRARARWERRDIVREGPPAGKWRLVLCRNLAIYLTLRAKERLHDVLARALAVDGILMLGRSERITDPARYDLERIGPHTYRKLLRWD